MKKINITLNGKELRYDIGVTAYTVGDGMPEEAAKERYRVQSALDEENIRKVNILINTAWRNIITAATAYIWGEEKQESNVDDKLMSREVYSVTLNVPDSHPEEAAETLVSYAHDYVVNSVLSQWFLLTKKDEAEAYAVMANNGLMVFKRALTLRKHPCRVSGWKL